MALGEKRVKRIFFVGAGLSASCGYPLGNQLVPALMGWLKSVSKGLEHSQVEESDRRPCATLLHDLNLFLRRYFPSYFKTKLLDVAEFYSIAQAVSETPEIIVPTDPDRDQKLEFVVMRTLYPRIAAATRTMFMTLYRKARFPRDVTTLLDSLNPDSDVIINFNWDEKVDAYLTTPEGRDIAYTRGSWRDSDGDRMYLTIKPHGSINWYDVTQDIGNPGIYPISSNDPRFRTDQRRIIAYWELKRPRPRGQKHVYPALACPPAITPPTFAKRFSYHEQHWAWQDMIHSCREAEELVFLGYRMPKDDYLTRAALRGALETKRSKPRVVVVSMDDPKNLTPEFQDVFGKNFTEQHVYQYEFGSNKDDVVRGIRQRLKALR